MAYSTEADQEERCALSALLDADASVAPRCDLAECGDGTTLLGRQSREQRYLSEAGGEFFVRARSRSRRLPTPSSGHGHVGRCALLTGSSVFRFQSGRGVPTLALALMTAACANSLLETVLSARSSIG